MHYNGDTLSAVLWLWLLYVSLNMEIPGIYHIAHHAVYVSIMYVVKDWFESLYPDLPPSISMSKITKSDPSSLCWNDIEVISFSVLSFASIIKFPIAGISSSCSRSIL